MSIHLPRETPQYLRDKLAGCNLDQEVVDGLGGVLEVEQLLNSAVKDESWCVRNKGLAERLIQQIEGKSKTVHKIHDQMQRILKDEEARFEEILKLIHEGKWSQVDYELPSVSELTEPHRLALFRHLAEKQGFHRFLDIFKRSYLSSCRDRTSIAIQFGTMNIAQAEDCKKIQAFFKNLDKFGIDDPKEVMRFAREIAENAPGYNLIAFAAHLDALQLDQDQRLEIANILANRDKTNLFGVEIYPLQVVINHMGTFQLNEEARIELAHQLMDRDQEAWSAVSCQMQEIASEDAEARETIARRFLEHSDESVLSCLVGNIEKFSLPKERLREIYASTLKRNQFRVHEENGDKITFSPSAFAELLGNTSHFGLSDFELRYLAFRARECRDDRELSALAECVSLFPLSEYERLKIAVRIADKTVSGEGAFALTSLCRSLKEFQLPEEGFEQEKFDLAMTIVKQYKRSRFSRYLSGTFEEMALILAKEYKRGLDVPDTLNSFEKLPDPTQGIEMKRGPVAPFLSDIIEHFRLQSEEHRASLAVALLTNCESKFEATEIFRRFSKFCLSNENVIQIVRNLEDPELLDAALNHIEVLAQNFSDLERLQLLLHLLGKLGSQKIRNSISSMQRLYAGDQGLVNENLYKRMNGVPSLYRAIDHAGLGEEILDLLPELFSQELLDRFSELTGLVKQLIRNTQTKNRKLVGHQLVSLLIYLMLRKSRGELSDDELVSLSPLFTSLLEYRVPVDRLKHFFEVESFLTGEENRVNLIRWRQIREGILEPLALIPAFALLYRLKPSVVSLEIDNILQRFQSDKRFLKDGKKRNTLIHLIQKLDCFSVEEALTLFEALYQEKKPGDRQVLIQKVIDLFERGKAELVKNIRNKEDIDQQRMVLIQEVFGLQEVPQLSRKYDSTFGQFRKGNLLLSYAILLASEFGAESEQMVQYRRYFRSVLEGDFPEMRYDHKQSAHLKMLFEGREGLEKQWKRGDNVKPVDLTGSLNVLYSAEDVIDANHFLMEAILVEKELGEDQDKKFPDLIQGLKLPPEQREETIQVLTKKLDELSDGLKNSEHQSIKLKFESNIKKTELQISLLQISQLKLDKASLFSKLSSLPSVTLRDTPFLRVITLLDPAAKGKVNVDSWSVVDTDDANDLLLMGAEIHSSCMKTYGLPGFCQGLLAYWVDGKNRLVAVKDEEGKLIGRVVLRMLWDGKKPVLFQERLYVNHQNPLVSDLIEKMCIRRAEALGLDLYCEDGNVSSVRLSSSGSPAPYEFVDAKMSTRDGVVRKGVFVLNKVRPIRLEG